MRNEAYKSLPQILAGSSTSCDVSTTLLRAEICLMKSATNPYAHSDPTTRIVYGSIETPHARRQSKQML